MEKCREPQKERACQAVSLLRKTSWCRIRLVTAAGLHADPVLDSFTAPAQTWPTLSNVIITSCPGTSAEWLSQLLCSVDCWLLWSPLARVYITHFTRRGGKGLHLPWVQRYLVLCGGMNCCRWSLCLSVQLSLPHWVARGAHEGKWENPFVGLSIPH